MMPLVEGGNRNTEMTKEREKMQREGGKERKEEETKKQAEKIWNL